MSASLCPGASACAGHAVQLALPSTAENVFAAHGAHGPPCCPKKPSRHRQFVAATLALSEVEFSAHCEHAALPSASL